MQNPGPNSGTKVFKQQNDIQTCRYKSDHIFIIGSIFILNSEKAFDTSPHERSSIAQLVERQLSEREVEGSNPPSKHAYMGPIWATHMGPIWGVQPGSAWVPYGLAHMRVAQMGPRWVPYGSHMGPI